jgi:lysozyme
MANERKRLSAAGWTALRTREHAVLHYYNDVANNCTYGIGTLAHHGPCTDEELQRPVSAADVNAQLTVGVSRAEAAVRRQVHDHELSQDEFDSLVSFTYNTGATGAHAGCCMQRMAATRLMSRTGWDETFTSIHATPMADACQPSAYPVS